MKSTIEFWKHRVTTALLSMFMLIIVAAAAWSQSPITLGEGQSAVVFPATTVGLSAAVNILLTANAPLTLVSVSAHGDFTLENTACNPPVILKAGDTCSLGVTFTPSVPGPRWSALLLTDSVGKKYAFGLIGTGTGPALAFTPGIVSTVAGNGTGGYSGDGGIATSAELNMPMGITSDGEGNLYVADFANNVVREIASDGTIATIAGNGTQGYSGDGGPATGAQLSYPAAVALDTAGNLYIAEFLNSCVRKVDANGTISTLASGFLVRGVAVDNAGSVYYSSWFEGVWKVDSQGVITKVVGNGNPGFSGDGGPATEAQTSGVAGITVDDKGNLYLAEVYNSDIRKVDTNGIITTVAGDQQFGFAGDGGPAASAQFNGPTDIRIDPAGDLYIVDSSNNRIRKVNANGIISTIAGDGNFAYAGDGGLASNAQFAGPIALTLGSAGSLLIADTGNNVVRKVTVDSTTLDFGTVTVGQTGGPVNVIVSNTGNQGLTFDSITASAEFGVQTTCSLNSGLQSGEECAIDVSFNPTNNGSITGSVSVADNSVGNPHLIRLKGQGFTLPVATQLVFGNLFPTRELNSNLGTVIVKATDASGNLASDFNASIGLTVQGPMGFATYAAQANATNGIAAFDLSRLILNVAGSYSITSTSTGLVPAQASFLVIGDPDFSITTSAKSMSLPQAGSGTIDALIAPINGYTGNIALTCSGLPAHSVCTFVPISVQADGSDTNLVSRITISTGVASVGMIQNSRSLLASTGAGIGGTAMLALIVWPVGIGRPEVRRTRLRRFLVCLAVLCIGFVGCGRIGGSSDSHLTPAGNYTTTVTGVSNGTSHSSSVNLVVQ